MQISKLATSCAPVFLQDFDGVADMVVMAVGQQHVGDALGRLFPAALPHRIVRQERIDEDGRAAMVDAKCGMSVPGHFHGQSPPVSCNVWLLPLRQILGPEPARTNRLWPISSTLEELKRLHRPGNGCSGSISAQRRSELRSATAVCRLQRPTTPSAARNSPRMSPNWRSWRRASTSARWCWACRSTWTAARAHGRSPPAPSCATWRASSTCRCCCGTSGCRASRRKNR